MLYKALNVGHYKEGMVFKASDFSYSHCTKSTGRQRKIYEHIFEATDRTGVGLDTFITLTNMFYGYGYSNNLLGKGADSISTKEISPHSHLYESESLHAHEVERFFRLCKDDKFKFLKQNDATPMWEYLHERVRRKFYPEAPSRLVSYFAFRNLDDCKEFADRCGREIICEIDDSRCTGDFEADMTLIDDIPNHFTYRQASDVVKRYWAQERSPSPRIEVLLEGEIRLGKQISRI